MILIVLAVPVALLAWVVLIFNRLTTLDNRRANAYAQIDVQLKRRHDLIPNLVETVKGYMAHEKQTLEAVINARSAAMSARSAAGTGPGTGGVHGGGSLLAIAAAESALGGALGGFLARVEAYPELKADSLTSRLMEELSTTENRIAFARQSYNDSVMTYNAYRQSFPQVVVAPVFGFANAELFELADTAQRAVPTVSLNPTQA
jgi:LemA protein